MLDLLAVPFFPRLHEYCGVWCMEPRFFADYWRLATSTDLDRHMLLAAERGRESPPYLTLPAKGGKSIAVLRASGPLMKQQPSMGGTSTIALRRQMRQAAAEETVSGILLAIDSPGGTVAGISEAASEIKAASKKKPVWAYIEDLGASAAYWLASQADVIYANSPTALVGSIGTIVTVYDQSQLAEREGVKALVFATGPLKGAGVPGTQVTDEQQAYFQGIVDSTQTYFDAAVMKGRGLTRAQLAEVRSGGVFPATVALERRLIDAVRPFDAVVEALGAQK